MSSTLCPEWIKGVTKKGFIVESKMEAELKENKTNTHNPAMKPSKNGKSGLAVRVLVSLTLLLIIISYVDVWMVLGLLTRVDFFYFGVMLLLLLADRFLMAYKWKFLIRAGGTPLSMGQCLRVYLISGFFGAFLPSSIGADIYRIYYTSKRAGSTEAIIASVILERFIGIVATATFAFLGLVWLIKTHPQPFLGASMTMILIAFLVLSLIGLWLSIQQITLAGSEYLLNHLRDNWFFKKWLQCQRAYVAYRHHKRMLLIFFLLSVLEQSLFPIVNYWGARAMGLNIEFVYFIGIIPICLILMRLPISINAIGVQEGLYVFFFSRLGLSVTEAFSFALLVRIATWVIKLLGAILYLTESSEQRQALQYSAKQ